MSVSVLKDYLNRNGQPKVGLKGKPIHTYTLENLVRRCADGSTLGAIPDCPVCSKGPLYYSIWTGFYYCTIDKKTCKAKFTKSEIKRNRWYAPAN